MPSVSRSPKAGKALPVISPYQAHIAKWKDCQRCHLSESRSRVVFVRGSLPCEVLFVGEAPGESDNAIGQPFVGPAGRILDKIIACTIPVSMPYAITHLVGCIPKDEEGKKPPEPEDDCILKCTGKLRELYRIAKPRVIVSVGTLAANWVPEILRPEIKQPIVWVEITHPSAILRAPIIRRGLMVRQAEIKVVEGLNKEPTELTESMFSPKPAAQYSDDDIPF